MEIFRCCRLWTSGGISRLRRYSDRRRGGHAATATASHEETDDSRIHLRLALVDRVERLLARVQRALLAVQFCYRRYVSLGCSGHHGSALRVLLSCWSGEEVAHGEKTFDARAATTRCPATTQETVHDCQSNADLNDRDMLLTRKTWRAFSRAEAVQSRDTRLDTFSTYYTFTKNVVTVKMEMCLLGKVCVGRKLAFSYTHEFIPIALYNCVRVYIYD